MFFFRGEGCLSLLMSLFSCYPVLQRHWKSCWICLECETCKISMIHSFISKVSLSILASLPSSASIAKLTPPPHLPPLQTPSQRITFTLLVETKARTKRWWVFRIWRERVTVGNEAAITVDYTTLSTVNQEPHNVWNQPKLFYNSYTVRVNIYLLLFLSLYISLYINIHLHTFRALSPMPKQLL